MLCSALIALRSPFIGKIVSKNWESAKQNFIFYLTTVSYFTQRHWAHFITLSGLQVLISYAHHCPLLHSGALSSLYNTVRTTGTNILRIVSYFTQEHWAHFITLSRLQALASYAHHCLLLHSGALSYITLDGLQAYSEYVFCVSSVGDLTQNCCDEETSETRKQGGYLWALYTDKL